MSPALRQQPGLRPSTLEVPDMSDRTIEPADDESRAAAFSRFLARIDRTESCWLWTGTKGSAGYGQMYLSWARRPVLAHRLAYLLFVGPVDDGLQLDHLCRVRHCVNPDHLEPVTQQENIRRGDGGIRNRVKTHCPKGHPYDEVNTRWCRRGNGKAFRMCRACHT
jgi:hypothetical protein